MRAGGAGKERGPEDPAEAGRPRHLPRADEGETRHASQAKAHPAEGDA